MPPPSRPRYVLSGIIATIALLALLAWRTWSEEAAQLKRTRQFRLQTPGSQTPGSQTPGSQTPVHTHTVTFTCSRTCTDLTQIPKVFPWNR